MIAVIADDITGAAEMAGIAHRLGLRVNLTMHPATEALCDVMVIATDSRSMGLDEAVAETRRVAGAIRQLPDVTVVFKKTDSALRGHVTGELGELIATLDYKDVVYLPANPSKGRIIRDGIYYVGDKPLHLTDFSFDPEFPAFSSSISERLPEAESKGIRCPDAVSKEDIEAIVASTGPDTLLAGAADLFTAFLKREMARGATEGAMARHVPTSDAPASDTPFRLDTSDMLVVCGSTQSKPVDCGAKIAYMPLDVYDGKCSADGWIKELAGEYTGHPSLILALAHRHRSGKDSAVYIRETMGDVVSRLVEVHCPRELVIEGGATAFAILRRLGWDTFTITDEIAPGVIRMLNATGTHITMKPGSYPWGPLFP